MEIQLPPEEAERLMRPVRGRGGFQSLQRRLQKQLSADGILTLNEDDMEKCVRYVLKYGQGGFQDRIKAPADSAGEEE